MPAPLRLRDAGTPRAALQSSHARPIRVRIAPSPTGPLHIGTARTALFNYLFARHAGGTFVLRLEDTDVARSTEAFERDILDGLHWLGIDLGRGPGRRRRSSEAGPYAPYRQMQRLTRLRGPRPTGSWPPTSPIPATARPDELDADRKAQEAARQPPRYVGRCAA